MSGRKKKLKTAQVIDALKQSHGLKTGACEILGVSFPTLERYVAELPEAREIIEHFRIRRTDRAEYKLDEAIERGEAWAVAMILKDHRGGRERGYGNTLDVNQSGVQKVIIEYVDSQNTDAPLTPSAATHQDDAQEV